MIGARQPTNWQATGASDVTALSLSISFMFCVCTKPADKYKGINFPSLFAILSKVCSFLTDKTRERYHLIALVLSKGA